MDPIDRLPNAPIGLAGPVSRRFRAAGIETFQGACRHVQGMPYGLNRSQAGPLVLFEEGRGTCTTKHAAIASLAAELELDVRRVSSVYPMTESLVTGSAAICRRYDLPYVPMIHCFLVHGPFRVDLTEGNRNGKNRPIDDFLHVERRQTDLDAKDEYRMYRRVLTDVVLPRPEMHGVRLKSLLRAREEALTLLKARLELPAPGL
jgi:hypothetical protein